MTDSNHKPTPKLRIYRKLFKLNSAFARAERNLNALLVAGALGAEIVQVWRNRIEEIRAEMNEELTGALNNPPETEGSR